MIFSSKVLIGCGRRFGTAQAASSGEVSGGIGLSGSFQPSPSLAARDVSGFYAGSNIWKFTYLGELDIIDDRTVASRALRDKYAAYGEVDLLLLDWLNLRGTFDFVKVTHNNDQTRYAIGAEPFISRVIQPRIQYRINNGPGSKPGLNQDELRLELHFFF